MKKKNIEQFAHVVPQGETTYCTVNISLDDSNLVELKSPEVYSAFGSSFLKDENYMAMPENSIPGEEISMCFGSKTV